jgi:hypothetical protein
MRVDLLSQLVKQQRVKFPKKASDDKINMDKTNAPKGLVQQFLWMTGSLPKVEWVLATPQPCFVDLFDSPWLIVSVLPYSAFGRLVLVLGLDSTPSVEHEHHFIEYEYD